MTETQFWIIVAYLQGIFYWLLGDRHAALKSVQKAQEGLLNLLPKEENTNGSE